MEVSEAEAEVQAVEAAAVEVSEAVEVQAVEAAAVEVSEAVEVQAVEAAARCPKQWKYRRWKPLWRPPSRQCW